MQMLMRGREASGTEEDLQEKIIPPSWDKDESFMNGNTRFDFNKSTILP